jgi:hypothetical protein
VKERCCLLSAIKSLAAAGTHMHRVTVDGEGMAPTEADTTDDAHRSERNFGLVSNFSSQNSSFRFVYRHKLLSFFKKSWRDFAVWLKPVSHQASLCQAIFLMYGACGLSTQRLIYAVSIQHAF